MKDRLRAQGMAEICHSRMKIVETSHCGVSMCFIAVGWTASASAGQDPLSLPGCCLPGSCLPGNCRRSPTYGYGRLRLSDAGTVGGSWKLTSLKSPIRRSQSSISFNSHNSPFFILIRRCKFACLCWRGFPPPMGCRPFGTLCRHGRTRKGDPMIGRRFHPLP